MMKRKYSREFKLEACRRAESGTEPKTHIARDLGISPSLLDKWLVPFRLKGEDAFDGVPWTHLSQSPEARIRELESALGRAHLEIEFMKECLGKLGRPSGGKWKR